jgi:hypothetical protein
MSHHRTAVASRPFTTALAAASAGMLTLSLMSAPYPVRRQDLQCSNSKRKRSYNSKP